jgi:meso-butanediol dehydrogenase/(S,S)-butanediol dehydrogenase/diacetyl reductase
VYDLGGKVAIVTGAARKRGLGRVIALRLAKEGADVVAVGRKYPEGEREIFLEEEDAQGWRGVDSLVQEIESMGRRGLALRADVTVSKEIDDLVRDVEAKLGKIDILINNAAYNWPHKGDQPMFTPVVELPEEVWDRIIDVNLKGPFLCCKAVARHMISRGEGGKIVNISSRAGKMGIAGLGAYCASKFGLNGLTQTLAIELAPYKIHVNAVCPGRIRTLQYGIDMVRDLAKQRAVSIEEAKTQVDAEVLPFIPLGRVAEPEEIANVVAFLCSKESDYMTGQAVNVTGGRIMY